MKVTLMTAHLDTSLTCFTCGRMSRTVSELHGLPKGDVGCHRPSYWMCLPCIAAAVTDGRMTLSAGTPDEPVVEEESAFEVSW